MNLSNKEVYQGSSTRIDFATGEVWVKIVEGGLFHRTKHWKLVPLGQLMLNTWYPESVETKDGRFSVKDLALPLHVISRRLGVMRLDAADAKRIWTSKSTLKGDFMAIDFEAEEIALKPSPFVLPFNSLAAVYNQEPPCIVYKHHDIESGKHSTRGISVNAAQLAHRLGIPLLPNQSSV